GFIFNCTRWFAERILHNQETDGQGQGTQVISKKSSPHTLGVLQVAGNHEVTGVILHRTWVTCYKGKSVTNMLADYCWQLITDVSEPSYRPCVVKIVLRKSNKYSLLLRWQFIQKAQYLPPIPSQSNNTHIFRVIRHNKIKMEHYRIIKNEQICQNRLKFEINTVCL
ncbi:hypothetical protein L9F63_002220, partial [Diploptera punctata]